MHAAQVPDSAGASRPGASCVDCHGEYVRGHPNAGLIPLVVDSSNCGSCHAATYAQWEHSQHAAEGVQCISCHSAHGEELRLTDETLCRSCHHAAVADPLHAAHWRGEVACTSCHLTDGANMQSIASRDPMLAAAVAPAYAWAETLGLISKCQMCATRLQAGQAPACTLACPNGALRFGKRNDLLAQAHGQIASNPGRYIDHIYGEYETGGTAVLYLAAVPFAQLGFPTLTGDVAPAQAEAIMRNTPVVALSVAALATSLYWLTQRRNKQMEHVPVETDSKV